MLSIFSCFSCSRVPCCHLSFLFTLSTLSMLCSCRRTHVHFANRIELFFVRLIPNMRRRERVFSSLAILGSFFGGAGLILLSGFDTKRYTTLHRLFLLIFILGVGLSAIFTVIEVCVILGVSSSVRSLCRGLRIESLLSLFCVFLCYDFYYYCAIFPVVGFGAGIGIWYSGMIGVGRWKCFRSRDVRFDGGNSTDGSVMTLLKFASLGSLMSSKGSSRLFSSFSLSHLL